MKTRLKNIKNIVSLRNQILNMNILKGLKVLRIVQGLKTLKLIQESKKVM